MKRTVVSQLDQLKAKLNGYVALLMYRYANLCIEADPISLLSVEVEIEKSKKRIEDVAQVAVYEQYHFVVIPKCEEDLFPLGLAVMKAHPEFKQELKTLDGYSEEDPEGKCLFYTMPEVNKERHDVMLEAVDAFYDECTGKMTAAEQYCVGKLAIFQADASPAEQEKTADMIKQIMEKYGDMRDGYRDDKKQEIEDAYAAYQAQEEERKAQEEEKKQMAGNPLQMLLNKDA